MRLTNRGEAFEWADVNADLPFSGDIAEAPGLYGPVGVPEVLVQKLWYRRDFNTHGLRTEAGKALRLLHPGRWNRLGGPDFVGGSWELEGERVEGDVEIHFYERDWEAHGHDRNPAFAGVRLHVLVFAPGAPLRPRRTPSGEQVETLVLGPYLRAGLEEYAWREAMRSLEGADPLDLAAPLLTQPVKERRARMVLGARRRWERKVHVARRRLAQADWSTSCHESCLEMLGLRANRAALANLATHFPLESWRTVDPAWIETRLSEAKWEWTTTGMRPANHPRERLRQYAGIVRGSPSWPEQWAACWETFRPLGDPVEATRMYRRRVQLAAARTGLRESIFHGCVPSPRLDTVVVDALLPLAAARWGAEAFFPAWWHWYPGDVSDKLRIFLRAGGLTEADFPLCNGLQQGAIDLLAERDAGG